MLARFLSITLLSATAVMATNPVSDLAQESQPQKTWKLWDTDMVTRGFKFSDAPQKVLTSGELNLKCLEATQNAVFPAAPYDLSDYHESYLPPKHLRDAWDAAYENNHLVIAHGFSAPRLRNIFEEYFSEIAGSRPTDLTAQKLLDLAPFCILELRNIISGCLMDLRQSEQHLCHYYDIGFLFKAPKECIFSYSNQDIHVASEGIQSIKTIRSSIEGLPQAKYSHQELLDMLTPAQRTQYLEDGNGDVTEMKIRTHKYRPVTDYWNAVFKGRPEFQALPKKFKYKWDHFTPSEIVSSTGKREHIYNEVAFVPRVTHPDQESRIVGIYYQTGLRGFGHEPVGRGQNEIQDPLSPAQTIAALESLAKKMGVPLIEL